MKLNEVTIVESKFNEEAQLDELNWTDVKRGAKKLGSKVAAVPGAIQRGAQAVQKGADTYTQGVKATGDAVAGAANALGRAGAETFKQTVARPVSGVWNAGKSVAQGATGAVQKGYGDVKQGVQTVGQGVTTAQTDIGNAAKFAGNVGTKALGGAAKTVGAVAGVPQGLGRATKRGYQAGVDAIGGPDDAAIAAQKRAAAKTAAVPKSFAVPGTVPMGSMSYSLPGKPMAPAAQPSSVDAAVAAAKSLPKSAKRAVFKELEHDLYGHRSNSGRRELSRSQKIKATKPPVAVAESKEYKVWGQK